VVTALYRRYRPETFAELIGQSQVTAPLMTALRTDRVNHAYLFSGPRGCGKTTSARILARCLNCAEGPTDTPCGVCPSCVDLSRDGGGSLDVVEIDAASHNGVDDARDLRERAIFAPVRDRYKIFILDEAHMVTTQGFNALLKIVEEPPAHIKFIFATTEPEKVIGTIRSRTHHYPFRLVPPAQMLEYLESVCESEGVQVAPGVISLVVRAGGGSVRDSLSLMDQLIAGSEGARVEYELATALLGFTHSELLNEVVDAFATRNGADVFSAVDRVIQTGQDPRRFVEDLLEHLRNLILVVSTGENAKSVLRGIAADEIEKMTIQAYQFGLSELTHAANVVSQSLNEMSGATSPKILLELMCARVLVPSSDVTEVGSLARIERLERRIGVSAPASEIAPASTRVAPAADAPAAPAAEPAPVESAPVSIGALTLAQVQKEWPEVLKTLAKISRSTWVAAQTIKIAALADGIVTLEFPNQSESDTFKRSAGGPENLRKAIQEVLGFTPQFKAQVAADSAPSLPPKVTSSLPSMPAPGPAFPEQISAPAPAPAAAPAKKSASAAAAPLPVAEEPVAPEPIEVAPEGEPTEEQPVAAAESGMGKVHQGASYGEPLLREILGAKPVDDIKGGR
jgi:DNA polymerase-3 subunit gamma/tau